MKKLFGATALLFTALVALALADPGMPGAQTPAVQEPAVQIPAVQTPGAQIPVARIAPPPHAPTAGHSQPVQGEHPGFSEHRPRIPERAGASRWHELRPFIADRPWLAIAANSEQRQPVYLGARPREIELGGRRNDAGLPVSLKSSVEAQAVAVRDALVARKLVRGNEDVELEGWPARSDKGALTWAFAWYAAASTARQAWIPAPLQVDEGLSPAPFLPLAFDPATADDYRALFADVLEFDDLYQKPLFGDAVWLDTAGSVKAAWLAPEARAGFAGTVLAQRWTARVLPQPARLDGAPVSYKLVVGANAVRWTKAPRWDTRGIANEAPAARPGRRFTIPEWPTDFVDTYRTDVMLLSGETEAVFPITGKTARFVHKNNIEPNHQLDEIVAYLEERYAQLGIETRRQTFEWRGRPQTNLVAILPGTRHDRPVLMGDHFDTAFCEDIFEDSKRTLRVSAPGADDNMSASAALLRAASVLKGKKLRNDIWLVHFTGEEFPADDLGARHFVSQLLASRMDISGLVLMDMIGWRQPGDRLFQISAGESQASLRLAAIARDAADDYSAVSAAVRTRFDPRSYLYNTDGLIFSDAGFPVILLNEHINALDNFDRAGYHDTTDVAQRIDWDYATTIAKIAITTAARLAGVEDDLGPPIATPRHPRPLGGQAESDAAF